MRARGHTMFWAVPHSQTPAWVEQLQGEDLVQAVEEHIDNLLEHFEAVDDANLSCIITLNHKITTFFIKNIMVKAKRYLPLCLRGR